MGILCGVDIGGTKLAAGLVAPDGQLLRLAATSDHTRGDEAHVMDSVARLVRKLCGEGGFRTEDLDGVAVGMAGHMRSRDGVALTTSNFKGFKNYAVTEELAKRLGVRVTLENDANCQAWAEHKYGAGRGFDDMVFITVSTGIGAGIIINNRLLRGQSGTAGEIGHAIADPNSELSCTCGNRGCFMALASTINLEQLARRKSVRHKKTRIFSRPEGEQPEASAAACRLDGRQVYSHAKRGDPVAMEIIQDYADYLGIMLYNVFQTFNPPCIVMGGGLMNWELGYFERMRRKFDELARDMLYDPIHIVKAEMGEGSGVIGAAALLLEN